MNRSSRVYIGATTLRWLAIAFALVANEGHLLLSVDTNLKPTNLEVTQDGTRLVAAARMGNMRPGQTMQLFARARNAA